MIIFINLLLISEIHLLWWEKRFMTGKDEEIHEEMMKTKGWRVSFSIIMSVAWLVFFFLWLFFYAGGYDFWQNVAIFIISILILGGVLGAVWAPWVMRYGRKMR